MDTMDSDALTAVGVGVAAVTALAATGAAYYLMTQQEPFVSDPLVLMQQSVELEDGSRVSGNCSLEDFNEAYFPDATTTYEGFMRGLRLSNNGDCVATRSGPNEEFEWLSYQQLHDRAHHFGSGLINLGIEPGQKSFLGIYSANRIEWDVFDLACSMYSMVSVPLYDTLNPTGCAYVLNHTEIETLVCETEAKLKNLLNHSEELKCLKRVISIGDLSADVEAQARARGFDVVLFSNVVASGKAKTHKVQPSRPEDLYTICYTSGTTGVPKGVMVTQRNIQVQISAILTHIEKYFTMSPDDRHLSYLPLAHMFERVVHNFVFMHGAKLAFFRGDVKLLVDDLKYLKPTFFFTVPRLVNKIYDKVLMGVKSSKIKTLLFNMAMKAKTKEIKRGIIRSNSIWDKLIFNKIAAALGGCLRFIVVSSAPLSVDVLNFLRCSMGVMVTECYGSSEVCGGCTCQLIGEFAAGHVGPPVPGYRVKLVDVPEMGYYASQNQGEVCVKSASVTPGYYKNPEKTAELIDSEGWAHSGDIGQWAENGVLKIIGRKKDIFKLSQGEYIAVEKIENVYLRCAVVLQIYVTGHSLQNFPVAVVVPDPDVLLPWARLHHLGDSLKDLAQNKEVIEYVKECMRKEGKRQGLCSFEQVMAIHLHSDPFTIEDGFLTPTLKNKRVTIEKHFAKVVTKLYQTANES